MNYFIAGRSLNVSTSLEFVPLGAVKCSCLLGGDWDILSRLASSAPSELQSPVRTYNTGQVWLFGSPGWDKEVRLCGGIPGRVQTPNVHGKPPQGALCSR